MALPTVGLLEGSGPTRPISQYPDPISSPYSKAYIQSHLLLSISSSEPRLSQLNPFCLVFECKTQ